jgi:ketosteroid isomerase-like protein
MSTATDLARRIEKAFNTNDGTADAFADCFAEDAVQFHPFFPAPNHGREAIRTAEGAMFAAFDQVQLSVTRVIDGGDGWVALEADVLARNHAPIAMPDGSPIPATGKVVRLTMASVLRVDDDGLIAEEHRYQDNLAFLRQLGLA